MSVGRVCLSKVILLGGPYATTSFRDESYFLFIRSDTLAALVLLTNCFPLEPALFFFLAVVARCDCDKLLAFDIGRQRSGFFLFLEVPQGPLIFPSVPMRTQFCALHLASSPITSSLLRVSYACFCHTWGLCSTCLPPCLHMQRGIYRRYALPKQYL